MKGMYLVLVVACALSLGCPGSTTKPDHGTTGGAQPPPPPPPEPEAPVPTAKLKGGWTVYVTSDMRPLDAASVDTPEKRAKVLYDHEASVVDNHVVVAQKTLGKSFDAKESLGVELDDVLTTADWDKIAVKTGLEEGIATGTIYKLVITRGDKKVEIATARVDKYPEVKKVVDTLRAIAGMP
jgi:hypothetical protein